MFFHVLPLVLKWATDEITCLVLNRNYGVFPEPLQSSSPHALAHGDRCHSIAWMKAFEAKVRLPISKEQVHFLRMYQACTHYIVLQHGLFVVKACSCPVMFEFWNSVEWTHTGSAALTHWLMRIVSLSGIALLASSGQKSSDNTPQATQYLHPPTCFQWFHIMLTLGQLDHSWKRALTSNDNEVNDKTHHYQGAKAASFCKVLPHLGVHLSLLSWTATAGTSENAHKHGPAFDLSLVNQCAKIKLGSWVQPTALVHFELKLSLYVCQPKLDMQCIEILSRAMPRLLAVSNAMPPNRNMPAYLKKWKMFFELLNWNNSISLGFRRNSLLPRSKQCLSFRQHIESTYPSGIIRPPALPTSL